MKTINYKGKGNHSVSELELIIEQQAEELHLFKSGQQAIDYAHSSLPLKENEETAFDLWLKNFKEVDGCYWFDKETLYVKQAMKDIYKETVKPQL